MCDKELLVGYLYDEVDAAERRTMESHLLACAECRGELKDLRGTRTRLAAWAPPTPELEFQMVRAPEAAASRARPWSILACLGTRRRRGSGSFGRVCNRKRRSEVRSGRPDGADRRVARVSCPARPGPRRRIDTGHSGRRRPASPGRTAGYRPPDSRPRGRWKWNPACVDVGARSSHAAAIS